MEHSNIIFRPIISSIQKILLYETKNKFFVVGSNNNQTKFRILKIDRTEPYDLVLVDDQIEYTEQEVFQILNIGNKVKASPNKTVSAFGIVGFIRFLEGYYMILITKRCRVAAIGLHVIYKIEDTRIIYIPHESYRVQNSDEPRYLKMFQSIDLSSNFYFSYSYDITHMLQINMASPNSNLANFAANMSDHLGKLANDTSNIDLCNDNVKVFGIKSKPNRQFVWNNYLLSEIESEINANWILYIMQGFIGQSSISIFGRQIYVTLVARRSNKYAGTRFLKRGANFDGDVANEVETEQMVIDIGTSFVDNVRVSSFVQMRGSIPAQWSQDITKMVTKPTITFDLSDPFYKTAGSHFNKLLRRYGSPIIVLNLVKKREKKKHESQLSEEFNSAISYLNQFLPPKNYIQYVTFDMARMNKGKEAKVMDRLAKIARSVISKTGLYLNNGPPVNNVVLEKVIEGQSIQTGVIRVNCVDCLDRTNTAQFALGKCALAYQLYYLGLLEKPSLDFDSDCVRMLEVLYEDHGDTLALQYGGSQLVHRIKTYRKTAPWTSQGNDIMQTLSRYYSNKFSDAEKQHAMNLFLGLFIPRLHKQPIWEQNIDYYLHHPQAVGTSQKRRTLPLTQWWDKDVMDHLPMSYDMMNKECSEISAYSTKYTDSIDAYKHFHKTDEFTVIGETYSFMITHSIRDFMPRCVTDFNPFSVRVRPGRMREQTTKTCGNIKNPSLTGQSSTSSANSSSSSSYYSEDGDDDTHHSDIHNKIEEVSSVDSAVASDNNHVYGIQLDLSDLAENNLLVYKRYALINSLASNKKTFDNKSTNNFLLRSSVRHDSDSFQVPVPDVSQNSLNIYDKYVTKTKSSYDSEVIDKYEKYLDIQLDVFQNNALLR